MNKKSLSFILLLILIYVNESVAEQASGRILFVDSYSRQGLYLSLETVIPSGDSRDVVFRGRLHSAEHEIGTSKPFQLIIPAKEGNNLDLKNPEGGREYQPIWQGQPLLGQKDDKPIILHLFPRKVEHTPFKRLSGETLDRSVSLTISNDPAPLVWAIITGTTVVLCGATILYDLYQQKCSEGNYHSLTLGFSADKKGVKAGCHAECGPPRQ